MHAAVATLTSLPSDLGSLEDAALVLALPWHLRIVTYIRASETKGMV